MIVYRHGLAVCGLIKPETWLLTFDNYLGFFLESFSLIGYQLLWFWFLMVVLGSPKNLGELENWSKISNNQYFISFSWMQSAWVWPHLADSWSLTLDCNLSIIRNQYIFIQTIIIQWFSLLSNILQNLINYPNHNFDDKYQDNTAVFRLGAKWYIYKLCIIILKHKSQFLGELTLEG